MLTPIEGLATMPWILRVKDVDDLEYFDTHDEAMNVLWEHAAEYRCTCPEYEYLCGGMDRETEIECSGIEYDLFEAPRPKRCAPVRSLTATRADA
jgi:hypothetical protein